MRIWKSKFGAEFENGEQNMKKKKLNEEQNCWNQPQISHISKPRQNQAVHCVEWIMKTDSMSDNMNNLQPFYFDDYWYFRRTIILWQCVLKPPQSFFFFQTRVLICASLARIMCNAATFRKSCEILRIQAFDAAVLQKPRFYAFPKNEKRWNGN